MARHPAVALALLLLALPGLRCGAEPSTAGRPFSSRQLQAIIDGRVGGEAAILGTIVRVDVDDGGTYEAASGYLDSSRTVPLTPDTRFLIGSITKTFTAVLVLQLAEKGAVRLQDPLIDHLPPEWSAILEQIEYGREVTVEHALRHRSGLADFTNSDAFWESLVHDPSRKWRPIDVLERIREEGEAQFKPGDRFDYCNTNYILLGALLEQVSGRSYRDLLQVNILDRVGLDHTFLLQGTPGSADVPIAHGYTTIDGRLRDADDVSVDWAIAAGGLVSTAADLSRFFRALRSGDLFERDDTYQRMCQLGPDGSYGLGLEAIEDPEIGPWYGHKGSFLKSRAVIAYFPEQHLTVTVCHTYRSFSMTAPEDLMKFVVQRILGREPAEEAEQVFEGPDLFADIPNVRVSEDRPARGTWDFDPQEEWRLDRIEGRPLERPVDLAVRGDGTIYLLDRGSGGGFVLDRAGTLLHAFGEPERSDRAGLPRALYVAADTIHVLYMGNVADTVIDYDEDGTSLSASGIAQGLSPRAFVGADRYVAVRSSPDVLKRPENELLELVSLGQDAGTVLGKFPAEDKLLLTTIVPRGRYIHLEDDVEIFPRLIVHFDGNMLFVGRSDRYQIRKIDLDGNEHLAFSLRGREPQPLPVHYASDRVAERTIAGGREMPEETRERFVAAYPRRQTLFTRITTDGHGLIYVFVPDIVHPGVQAIDIFSPEGEYLYHAVIELPDGLRPVLPLVLDADHLVAVVKSEQGRDQLVRYGIRIPAAPEP